MLKRYEPTPEQPWNVGRVVHLHRRAGFAASWSEIQRDLVDGPEVAVARLLHTKANPQRANADEAASVAKKLGQKVDKVLIWQRYPGKRSTASKAVKGRDFYV
ncbi:MAG: hypothetical protein QGG71_25510, partial [Pirellulaceae bacterium]|nr:hypothetical protein [Pirellulaceae bacterium]